MTTKVMSLLLGFALLLVATACKLSKAASTTKSAAKGALVTSANSAASKLTKNFFVGEEHPCECNRTAIDAGWAALQTVLGLPANLPVERLQVDTEGAKVEPYRSQKPIMVLPAIYFLDGKGAIVDLLQGEVTAE